jgi:MFS transporter, NNP family, nitrate/nitrite transporter
MSNTCAPWPAVSSQRAVTALVLEDDPPPGRRRNELVVVYGSEPQPTGHTGNVLMTGLRDRLPCRHIAAIPLLPHPDGSAPTPLWPATCSTAAPSPSPSPNQELADITAQLSTYLHADRVLKASYTLTHGVDLRPVWDRGPPASVVDR